MWHLSSFPELARRAMVVFFLVMAVLLGLLVSGASARRFTFRCETFVGGDGHSIGQYSAHWYDYSCGYDAVYLDSTAQRVMYFDNQCDVGGAMPVDPVDVNAWISYVPGTSGYDRGHVAYMTAAGDLRYAAVGWGGGEDVDTTGVTGAENSIVVDPAPPGPAYIAYRDVTHHALKFARPRWAIEVVDTTGDTGHGPSLAIDAAHVAHVSYVRHISGPASRDQLVYATRTTGGWQFETAGNFAAGAITTPTSLALSGAEAWVAFGDHTTGALRLGHRVAGSWSWTVVDSSESGAWTSLRLDSHGDPFIAYFDARNGDLKFANQDSAGWTVQRVDSAGVVGEYPWMRIDGQWPSISYHDATNGELKLAQTGLTGGVPGAEGPAAPPRLTVCPSPLGANGATIELRGAHVAVDARPRATIHDVRGRLVATLTLAPDANGADAWSVRWDAAGPGGRAVPAGVYVVTVPAGDDVVRAKTMVLR